MDGTSTSAPAPQVRPLLPWDDPWADLKTRSSSFEGVVPPGEVVSLNHIRDMTGQRNIACVREGNKSSSVSNDQAEWFVKYLSNLALLLEAQGDMAAQLSFEWSSPTSGRGFKYFQIRGLKQEQAMATFLYASLERQLGHQRVDDAMGLSAGSTAAMQGDQRAAELAEAVRRLRQAAGIWQALADDMLPPLAQDLAADRPAELVASMAHCMSLLALGEAQAVTAFRAEERGSPGSLVASLQAAAADLFEQAAKVLRNRTADFNQVSDRLKRCIALSSSLASERAYRAAAVHLLGSSMDGGQAGRAMQEAGNLLTACQQVASGEGTWSGLIQQEVAALEPKRAKVESERLYVYCQPLAREVPKLPDAKQLVTPLPYTPERRTSTAAEVALG